MSIFDLGNNSLRNNELQRKIQEEALFEQAVNAVRSGTAPAGGNLDVPLRTSQKVTTVAVNVDEMFHYTTYDFTKNILSKTVNSGIDSNDWEFDIMIPDAMGYSFVIYVSSSTNDRRVQYVGPDAKVIDQFDFDPGDFSNQFDDISYYNGGVGLFMNNGNINGGNARFYYAYNGQLYLKEWNGTYYGVHYDGNNSATVNGAANFYTNAPDDTIVHNRIIPGEGFIQVGAYQYSDLSHHDVPPYFLPDGKPAYIGKFADYTITTVTNDNGGPGYLMEFLIFKDEIANYLDAYQLIRSELSNKYGVDNFNQIYLNNWSICRGGDAIVFTIRDNTTEDDYSLLLNVKTKTIEFSIDRALGQLILDPHPTALLWLTSNYNGSIGGFFRSNTAFKLDILYPDNTLEQFTIPRLSGGNDVFINFSPTISKNGNGFSLLSFVDDGDRQLKIGRSSKGKGISYTNLLNWKASEDYITAALSYSELKNEWFTQVNNYLTSLDKIDVVSISKDGILLGPPTTINTESYINLYTHGYWFTPHVLHLVFPGGVNQVWRLNYSNYKWEEVKEITAVPTGDGNIEEYTEIYYGGYTSEGGSSYIVYVDLDALFSVYFSSKYGAVKTNNVPTWSIAPTGQYVGLSYTTVFDGNNSFAIATSTGKQVSGYYVGNDTPYTGEAVSDGFIYLHGPGGPGKNKFDCFAGWKKKTIDWYYSIDWQFHDIIVYNF